MTEQRKREIRYLERLRSACRVAAKERRPGQPQLGDFGLHVRSPEWSATYGALADAGYYDAAPKEWSRRINAAIQALNKETPRAKSKGGAR